MQNADEQGPGGSVHYENTGARDIGGGKLVPTFTKITTLAPDERTLYDQQNALNIQLQRTAGNQLTRLGTALDTPFTADGLPAATTSLGSAPNLTRVGSGPQLATGYDYSLAPTTIGDAGPIQRSVGPNDFSADRLRVEDALNARLNPQLAASRDSLETRLVNQGLTRGTAAFNSAMDEAARQENDAHLAVTAQGGQEQSRLFGNAVTAGNFANAAQSQDFGQQQQRSLFGLNATAQNNATSAAAAGFSNDAMQQMYGNEVNSAGVNNTVAQQEFGNAQTAAEFANTARERALQEQAYFRNQPINEISALTNGVSINVPTFAPFRAASADPAPIASSVYASANIQQQQYAQQVAARNATMSGLFGLAGSAARLGTSFAGSDIALKEDIRSLGIRTAKGFALYAYRYRNDPARTERVGVMAQEVLPVMPAAVARMSNGYLAVDYMAVL